MMLTLRTAAVALCSALFLSGCTSTMSHYFGDTVGGANQKDWREEVSHSSDPLLDAPYHAEMTCTSETPITVLSRVKEVSFACADIGVSAKIDEIRDAGWRVVNLDIGGDKESDGHVGFPVSILVRKLY